MKSIAETLLSLTGKTITVISKNKKTKALDVTKGFLMSERLAKIENFEYEPNHAGCYLCKNLAKKEIECIDPNYILRVFNEKNKEVFCSEKFKAFIKNKKGSLKK